MSKPTPDEQAGDGAAERLSEQNPTAKPAVPVLWTEAGYRVTLQKWREKALLRALDALEPMCDLATDETRDPADTADSGLRALLLEYDVLPGLELGKNDENSP